MSNKPAFTHFGDKERELLKKWVQEQKPLVEIAKLLSRDLSTIVRQAARLKSRKAVPKVGRPPKISSKQADLLVKKAQIMVKAADAKYQVTADMIKKGAKLTCCTKVVLKALHSKGVYLRPMREKPVRTEEDDAARLAFGNTYRAKPLSFWTQRVHAYIDNKYFPVYLSPKARSYAAKLRGARGTFRKRGEGLGKGHVKPRKNLKMNFGAKSVLVSAAVCAKGVLMWHVIKCNWNAKQASDMYSGVLAPALQAKYPGKHRFTIQEDNDPSGYKSNLGKEAKAACHLHVLEQPKRSPDLNPLDYGLWAEINRRMRIQERKFPRNKHETREAFIVRLRRTALRIPTSYCAALVKSMKRRCEAVVAAKGGDFDE